MHVQFKIMYYKICVLINCQEQVYMLYVVQVHENDVEGIRKDNDDKSKWFKCKVEELQYPPKIKLDISCDEKKVTTEKIKFTLHFSGIQETGCSKSCDKKVHLYARSKWFTDNKDDQWSK